MTKTPAQLEGEVAEAICKERNAHLPEPATMQPAKINAELDRLGKKSSKIGEKLIAAGRGYEKYWDTMAKTDPLAIEFRVVADRERALRHEIERRMGPGKTFALAPRIWSDQELVMFAGDDPELWTDAELKREITKHLGRGPHSMKAIRRFHDMMDELVERRQVTGAKGTPSEIWARCVEELSK